MKNTNSIFGRGLMSGLIALGYVMTINVVYAFSSFYVAFQTATGFTSVQMGLLVTVIGAISVILYFPAGLISDRFSTKSLIVWGMIGSGICAIGVAMMPSFTTMMILYGAMGVFSTGLVQVPSMKATRLLGTDEEQGTLATYKEVISKGVGLVVSFFGVWLVGAMATERLGMQMILYIYAGIIFAIAIVIAIFFKPVIEDTAKSDPIRLRDFGEVLKVKGVWLAGIVGFGIYSASIGLVYIQPYMSEVYGLTTSQSSTLGVIYKQLGIVAAPVFSWLLVKCKWIKFTPRLIAISLALTFLCFVFYVAFPASSSLLGVAIAVFITASFMIMGAWAFGYVTISEIRMPVRVTGTAFSVYNLLMYLGDLFLYTLFGGWADQGGVGYAYVFVFTAAVLLVAVIAACMLVKEAKNAQETNQA